MGSGGGVATDAGLPATAEEEAHKRNTDCVYFLASPLTCKKGSECEYRHSEGARVNPRDCWYWLNGECLNPKCSFRHPPLDPLFGIPEAKTGSPQPPFTSFPVAHGPSAYNMNKQNVPCYYFQKGHCLKGDKCPFMHGSSTIGDINPQHVPAICSPVSDPTYTNNKEKFVKECTSQQGLLKESVNKREMASLSAKPVVIESEPNNGSVIVQNASPYPSQYDYPSFESNSLLHSWPESIQAPSEDEHLQAGREVDELLGESSPGFDVLVDDHEEDPDYYQNDEEYGKASVQGGRNLKPLDDFDHRHYDYEHISGFERENFTEGRGYDRYRRSHDPYDREKLRISSERRREKSPTPEKRKYDTDCVDESDLRHRLKQRRLNSRRPAISPYRHPSRSRVAQRLHEQGSRIGNSSREYQSVQEGFVGSRLHGRISLPVRSQIEINQESNQNRSSTGRPVNYQGTQHERIKSRQTDMNYGLRKYDGQTNRRVEADALDFAGPKSLAELKCAKVSEDSQNQKGLVSKVYQDSENSLSFEGPKPLSLILKKKKDIAFSNGSCNIYGSNHKESEDQVVLCFDGHLQHASEATEAGNTVIVPEAPKITEADGEEEEGMIQEENEELLDEEELSEKGDVNEDDGLIVDSVDYNETDNYDEGEGEFDYGETDGGEFKPEDDEVYQEDVEEYDEDDFAKRAGFMLS